MPMFSPEFFTALVAIVVIDLVLAGDNAIVIALAARRLPAELRRRAVLWGTLGAVVVRVVLTLGVVYLLKLPGLNLFGGLLLIPIAVKLLDDNPGEDKHGATPAAGNFWAAMRTIVIADALMGLDNVLAVAGAAHGSFALVVIGLVVSVPIMAWGSNLILRLLERWPTIVYIGAGALLWTAARMLAHEPLLQPGLESHPAATPLLYVAVIGGGLALGWLRERRQRRATQ